MRRKVNVEKAAVADYYDGLSQEASSADPNSAFVLEA